MKINDKLMKEVMEKITPVVLFEGKTNTSFTLSQSIANFKRIKIFSISTDNNTTCNEYVNNYGSNLNCSPWTGSVAGSPGVYYGKSCRCYISNGTNVTIDREFNVNLKSSTNNAITEFTTAVYITRIEGYYI